MMAHLGRIEPLHILPSNQNESTGRSPASVIRFGIGHSIRNWADGAMFLSCKPLDTGFYGILTHLNSSLQHAASSRTHH